MKHYRIPKWLKRFYPGAIWDFSFRSNSIFLTFDDGPNPSTTPYLLELLDQHQIKATFFCLGKNVQNYPELFEMIIQNGHEVGNHSMNHPKGLHTTKHEYVQDVVSASQFIPGKLFRPPYGKIKPSQFRALKKMGYQTIFWSVLSYDFDQKLATDEFIETMMSYCEPGSIYVFHDSDKAAKTLQHELPELIQQMKMSGYHFAKIEPGLFS
ncbi:MAG: polysaccharide deacetylase family protein [Crocinitomicaceae bacterium]|nr:polysaccharide deacetylase family protein [Crocinitomicaceae bacterium]